MAKHSSSSPLRECPGCGAMPGMELCHCRPGCNCERCEGKKKRNVVRNLTSDDQVELLRDESKVLVLAKILAGYDDITWNKLKAGRKRTYIRAATSVICSWDQLVNKIEEFKLCLLPKTK